MSKWSQFSEDQKDQLLESLEGLYEDPEVGVQVKEAVEKKFGFTDPGLALRRHSQKQYDDLQEKDNSLESSIREKEIKSRTQSEHDAARDKYKLSDDDMKEVSKLMIESGIASYDKAADYFRLQKQAAIPTTDKVREHSQMRLPGDEGLFKNPVGWARDEAYKVIGELERNRV